MTGIYDELKAQDAAQPAAPSLYDQLAEQDRQEGALRASVQQATADTPEAAAKRKYLTQVTGLPDTVVKTAEGQAQAIAKLRELQQASANSPVLRDRLTDPSFATLAQNDGPALSGVEGGLRKFTMNVAAAVGSLARAPGMRAPTVDGRAPLVDLAGEYVLRPIGGDALGNFNKQAYGLLAAPFDLAAWALEPISGSASKYPLLPANPARAVADFLHARAQAGEQYAKAYGIEAGDLGPTGKAVASGISSLWNSLLLAPLGIELQGEKALTQVGAAAVPSMRSLLPFGVSTAGGAYEDAMQAKLPGVQAALYAAQQGGVEMLTEALPFASYIRGLRGEDQFLKTLGRVMLEENVGEQIATAWQDANEWLYLHPEKSLGDYLDERPQAALQTLISTTVATGLQAGIMHAANSGARRRLEQNQREVEQARQDVARLQELLAVAGGSQVRELDQATFAAFTQAAAERARAEGRDAPTSVWVDGRVLADTLAQSGMTPEQIDAAMPSLREQLADAQTMNRAVEIPIGELAAALPGSALEQALVPNLRVREGGLSLNEAKEAQQQAQVLLQQEAERVIGQAADAAKAAASTETVRQKIKAELDAVGRFSSDVNDKGARLAAQFYTVMAARLNTTPERLYNDLLQYKVRGEGQGTFTQDTQVYPEFLPTEKVTKEQMLARGAGGHLASARERYIPLNKIDGREPTPAASDERGYEPGRPITEPIEVKYDRESDTYTLYAGNHRVTQAELNGDKYIRAFVEPDAGSVGASATTLRSKAGLGSGLLNQSVSTRLPWAKPRNKEVENPLATQLVVGLDAVARNPTLLEKFAARMDKIVSLRTSRAKDPKKRLENYINQMVDNLLWLHDQMPAELRERAKLWYDGARAITERLQARYEDRYSDVQIAAVLAVMSPQMDWFTNVTLGERILDVWDRQRDFRWTPEMSAKAAEIKGFAAYEEELKQIEGKTLGELDDDFLQALWIAAYDRTYHSTDYRIVTPEGDFTELDVTGKGKPAQASWANGFGPITKAVAILKDGSIENVSAQLGAMHKVRNFYNNIFAPSADDGSVTIDTHAVAAALLMPFSGTSPEVADNFGAAGSDSLTGIQGTFAIYAEAYRRAAAQRGLLAREMQSITWEAVRGLFSPAFKRKYQKDTSAFDKIWKDYHAGKVELNDARQQLLDFSGGIAPPSWAGRDSAQPTERWSSSYAGELLAQSGMDGAAVTGAGSDDAARAAALAQGAGDTLNQPAYHGSPHRFPRFDLSKMGTGEGAQAFGWGQYFGGAIEVGKSYVPRDAKQEAAMLQQYTRAERARNYTEMEVWEAAMLHLTPDELIQSYSAAEGYGADFVQAAKKVADWIRKNPPAGQLYRVDIPDEAIATMLDWDKPLSEQPEAVRKAIADAQSIGMFKNVGDDTPGKQIYNAAIGEAGGGQSGKEASELLSQLGIPGLRYFDGQSRGAGEGTQNTVVWDQAVLDRISDSIETLYQPTAAGAPARGTYDIRSMTTVLNGTADLSTFLHETGHFFLDALRRMVASGQATPEVLAMHQAALKALGVTEADWNAWHEDYERTGTISDGLRAAHEKWAETFEAYLFTGQAPSVEVRSLFRTFAAWLKRVYQSLEAFTAKTGTTLDPDLKAVMDRMLATDEQIAEAELAAGLTPNLDATAEAQEKLNARSLRDLKWAVNARNRFIAKLQKEAARLRKALEAEVRAEVELQPVYRAEMLLRYGRLPETEQNNAQRKAMDQMAGMTIKLGLPQLKEMYGDGPAAPWRYLATGKNGLAAAEGVHPDVLADALGFPSGDALVRALLSAEPISSVVEGITDQRMLERHGDLATPEAIAQAATEAVHNEARARSLATELAAQREMLSTRRDTGEVNAKGQRITVNVLMEAAKNFATGVIGRQKIGNLKKAIWAHVQAERRAAKAWQQATAAGKTQEAVQAKQDQLLNNAAVRAGEEARRELQKAMELFKRVTRGTDEKLVERGYDPDIANAARAILAAYGIAPAKGKSAVEYLETLQKNDPATYAAVAPSVSAALLNAKPFDELTVDEMLALTDEVESLWHLARRSRQMEVDGQLLDREAVQEDLKGELEARGIPDVMPGDTSAITPAEQAMRKLQAFRAAATRAENWAQNLGALFTRYVFQPVKEAANRYRADKTVYLQKYRALLDAIAPSFKRETIDAPELGYTFGRDTGGIAMQEVLHAILHTGNESNKRKLLLGRRWATEREDGTLDTSRWDAFLARMVAEGRITKAHYDFAQGVWDLLEEMKPLAQKTHRDVFGRYFAEVTADAFDTPFGRYRGGYVPAIADGRIVSDKATRDLAEAENESMAFAFPATNRGFTKGRVEYNRPLLLDLRTLAQHIDKVLLFSHLEQPVRDVRRVLTSKSVAYGLNRIDPAGFDNIVTPWLNRASRQSVETPVAGDAGLMRILSTARSRVGMGSMLANLANAAQQLTGFSLAAVKVRPGLLLEATAQMIAHPIDTKRAVADASVYMRERMENEASNAEAAIRDILLNPSLYERAQAYTAKHAYFLQQAVDNAMGPIIWTAAYNQSIEKGASVKDAVRFADSVIRTTQGSTLPEDVSRIETGNAFVRLFTQFAGYFNMQANLLGTEFAGVARELGVRKGAGKMFYVTLMGFLAPAWVAEAIMQAFRGGPDDEDKDGSYLDDWLAAVFGWSTLRGATAMVPAVGPVINAAANKLNSKPYDDRIQTSPVIGSIESAVGAPASVYEAIVNNGSRQKAVRDVGQLITLTTGLPAGALARPLGYVAGMSDFRVAPTGPADMARGLATGVASPESRTR